MASFKIGNVYAKFHPNKILQIQKSRDKITKFQRTSIFLINTKNKCVIDPIHEQTNETQKKKHTHFETVSTIKKNFKAHQP